MTKIAASYGPAWAERDGDTLTGEMSYQASGKKSARRVWRPAQFDTALRGWFASASDGDRVEVIAHRMTDDQITLQMANPPVFAPPVPDRTRLDAADRLGGTANPYTFIPAQDGPAAGPGGRAAVTARRDRSQPPVVRVAGAASGHRDAAAAA